MGGQFDSNGKAQADYAGQVRGPAYAAGTQFYKDPVSGKQQSIFFGDSANDRLKSQQYISTQQGIGLTQQLQNDARNTASQVGTNFNQYAPQLQTNFAAKPGLDKFSQGLLSQGQQSINRGLGATQASIARSIQGPQSQILQNQAASQARLSANPLLFNVAAQQVGRQQQEGQLNNAAAIAQQGAYNTGLSASNQAQALKLGMQGLPVAAQQNLVSLLSSSREK